MKITDTDTIRAGEITELSWAVANAQNIVGSSLKLTDDERTRAHYLLGAAESYVWRVVGILDELDEGVEL